MASTHWVLAGPPQADSRAQPMPQGERQRTEVRIALPEPISKMGHQKRPPSSRIGGKIQTLGRSLVHRLRGLLQLDQIIEPLNPVDPYLTAASIRASTFASSSWAVAKASESW
jgi:hypothetical protein